MSNTDYPDVLGYKVALQDAIDTLRNQRCESENQFHYYTCELKRLHTNNERREFCAERAHFYEGKINALSMLINATKQQLQTL